jgi:hypothetical protein
MGKTDQPLNRCQARSQNRHLEAEELAILAQDEIDRAKRYVRALSVVRTITGIRPLEVADH